MNPLSDLHALALLCIDAAPIGPEVRAADLIASDPRLMSSARTRAMYISHKERWHAQVADIVARADAMIADRAINSIFWNGNDGL